MASKLLSQAQVTALIAAGEPGKHADGGSLFLVIGKGAASWVLRARWNDGTTSKVRDFNLGRAGARNKGLVDLATARSRAEIARNQVHAGIDPREALRPASDEPKATTFGDVVPEVIATKTEEARHPKTAAQWKVYLGEVARDLSKVRDRDAMRQHEAALADFRQLPIAAIKPADVADVLRPIWTVVPYLADQARERMMAVFDYAIVKELRADSNPAKWKGCLEHLLKRPTGEPKHYRAIPPSELVVEYPRIVSNVGKMSYECLAFIVLTAARSGEAREATWSEIDLENRIWSISGERMKMHRDHRIPLSKQAVAILDRMKHWRRSRSPQACIFPGAIEGRPLTRDSLLQALKRSHIDSTAHGLRSSFRMWASEVAHVEFEVSELCLSHDSKDKVVRAYQRSDLLERRRPVMQAWADYITRLVD